jgi:hypothetical protein
MTILIEKESPLFDLQTARAFFEQNREDLDDCNGFDALFAVSRFFNVYHREYVGSVFVYKGIDDRYYIGGYAKRKHHFEVVEALRLVAPMFDEVYAHTRHLNAVIALQKAGFRWFDRSQHLLKYQSKQGENLCQVTLK